MKLKFSALYLVFGMLLVSAQTKKWNLNDCIDYALENNISIKQFELDVTETSIEKSDAVEIIIE